MLGPSPPPPPPPPLTTPLARKCAAASAAATDASRGRSGWCSPMAPAWAMAPAARSGCGCSAAAARLPGGGRWRSLAAAIAATRSCAWAPAWSSGIGRPAASTRDRAAGVGADAACANAPPPSGALPRTIGCIHADCRPHSRGGAAAFSQNCVTIVSNIFCCCAAVRGRLSFSWRERPRICVPSDVAEMWRWVKRRLQRGSASLSIVSHHHCSAATQNALSCGEPADGSLSASAILQQRRRRRRRRAIAARRATIDRRPRDVLGKAAWLA